MGATALSTGQAKQQSNNHHPPHTLASPVGAFITLTMSQQLPQLMDSLSIAGSGTSNSSSGRPAASSNAAAGNNRLPPLMKKYMNPGLVRPPNSGLASHHAEAQRAALLNLATANPTAPPAHSSAVGKSSGGSPPPKPKASLQHTAHGLHGPAHATAARTQASAISSNAGHPSASSAAAAAVRKVDIGKYDGGFETDAADHEAPTGEAAKLLEMDSGSASG